MALTPKQEAFALAYVETGNASEAYRRAYSAAKMKTASIAVAASKLIADPNITLRVQELQGKAAEACQVTLEGHLQRLAQLSLKAEREGKYSAAVAAEISRGKAAGLYVEKTELTGANGGPVETVSRVTRTIVDPKA